MEEQNNKNLILAMVLSAAVMIVWFVLFPPPEPPVDQAAPTTGQAVTDGAAPVLAPAAPAAGSAGATPDPVPEAPRLSIDTPKLKGTISLLGGRVDDLSLKKYRETIDPNSDIVHLLEPVGGDLAYYGVFGWLHGTGLQPGDVPDAKTPWTLVGNETLTPDTPVSLRWDNGKGLTFLREISVDEDYMFTVTDRVQNATGGSVTLQPYGLIARHGLPKLQNIFVVHEGAIQRIDGELTETNYADFADFEMDPNEGRQAIVAQGSVDGWIGFTDHYWMTTLVPEQGEPYTGRAYLCPGKRDLSGRGARPRRSRLAPAKTTVSSLRFFAGAKEWETIRSYQNDQAASRASSNSIDWGWFYFLTKPIFAVLHWLNALIGNMGLAIIALTFVLKLLVLPLAYKSYVSMARMKELQPEMEALKERAGDDRQKLQREMMQLYKDKKVNPAAGCLPILIQIPIFFCALQGDLRHHRTAPCAVLRLAARPFGARSVLDVQPLRTAALGGAGARRSLAPDLHRRPADPAGHLDVAAAEAEPGADRPGAGDDLRLDALGVHVHAGQLCQRPGGLLDHQQHDHLHPAVPDHVEPRANARTSSATSSRPSWRRWPPRRQSRRRPRRKRARSDSPSPWPVAHLVRHPVKSAGRLSSSMRSRCPRRGFPVRPGSGPWRMSAARLTDPPTWAPKLQFLRGWGSAELMAISCRSLPEAGEIYAVAPPPPDGTLPAR